MYLTVCRIVEHNKAGVYRGLAIVMCELNRVRMAAQAISRFKEVYFMRGLSESIESTESGDPAAYNGNSLLLHGFEVLLLVAGKDGQNFLKQQVLTSSIARLERQRAGSSKGRALE